jgi:hypothetical protein
VFQIVLADAASCCWMSLLRIMLTRLRMQLTSRGTTRVATAAVAWTRPSVLTRLSSSHHRREVAGRHTCRRASRQTGRRGTLVGDGREVAGLCSVSRAYSGAAQAA